MLKLRCRAATYNIHVDGILVDHVPYYDYPNGKVPDIFFTTRDTLERTLRRLLYEPGGRIRWITGTVTGLNSVRNRVESVTIRSGEKNEEEIVPVSLFVGQLKVL